MAHRSHILPASRQALAQAVLSTPLALLLQAAAIPAQAAPILEHSEFAATLEAPFAAPSGNATRTFILHFTAPGAAPRRLVDWTVELRRPDGGLLRQWRGRYVLRQGEGQHTLGWRAPPLPDGIYQLRLQARPDGANGSADWQEWPLAVGSPALLATPAAAPSAGPLRLSGLPYDILLGNLHSQTGHSDGGGAPATCHAAQPPHSSPLGPADAYSFAQGHGLDFLMASEHNHMYDGSDGSDPDADPGAARQLYRLGLANAEDYTRSHPGFIALYGMEWGVIDGGGHLNIFNSPALLGWERDRQGQLFGDVFTARGDYASLYRLMQQQGWLGQFNHANRAQFRIGSQALAYSAEGDQAMALCEVLNSAAFSAHLDEGENHLSRYEEACNTLLEAGYHLAFSSNQDNHCANWGASSGNRTGILLPAGSTRDAASLLEAIRARRVFATMDKQSAIALVANGHLMGERFDNHGPLQLEVQFASRAGRSIAALELMEGVPGRHGTVRSLPGVQGVSTTITPAPGPHFYYARLTQDDGRQLWSAPIWVNQH